MNVKMDPKVTIITICWNTENEIEETLRSILEQTYKDYEILVKDGLSKDKTCEIVNRVIAENPDSNIRLISKKDSGIYNAMNQAIDEARGEWLIFANCGDGFYKKDSLAKMCEAIAPDVDVIYGDACVRDKYGDAIWRGDLSIIETKMPFCHQASMIRTAVAREIRFNESLKIAADYNMMLGAHVKGYKFKYADAVAAVFNLDGVSSTKFENNVNERFLVRFNNGVIGEDYKNSAEYKKEIRTAKIKTVIDKVCPKFLMGWARNFYKTKIRKYEKVEA